MKAILSTLIDQLSQPDVMFFNDYTSKLEAEIYVNDSAQEYADDPPSMEEINNDINTFCKILSEKVKFAVDYNNMIPVYNVMFAKRYNTLKAVVLSELSTLDKQRYYYKTVVGSEAVEIKNDEQSEYMAAVRRNLSTIVYYILTNIDKEYSGAPLNIEGSEPIEYGDLVALYGDNIRIIAESISTDLKLGVFSEGE